MTVTREVVEHFDNRPAASGRLICRDGLVQRTRPSAVVQKEEGEAEFAASFKPQQKLIQIGPLDV